jgi:hypothetical protein
MFEAYTAEIYFNIFLILSFVAYQPLDGHTDPPYQLKLIASEQKRGHQHQ